jgi:hypothetical protein
VRVLLFHILRAGASEVGEALHEHRALEDVALGGVHMKN